MQAYRCLYPHPDFPNQCCDARLFDGDFDGEVQIKCWRCGQYNTFDRRTEYTAAVALDKVAVAD